MPSGRLSGEEATFDTSPEWAQRHFNFTLEDWCKVVWTDETYISDGPVNKTHVTPKANEENNSTCTIEQQRKNNSWMFWGCFVGTQAGLCVFWERTRGKMSGKSYRQRILPDALGFFSSLPTNNGQATLMHDNAPVHTAAPAREYLEANGVVPMAWLLFSPDLNPIENVWILIKTYIQDHHGDSISTRQRSRAQVRLIVLEAWRECTRPQRLLPILQSMRDGCEAVIQAQGGSIP
ncbi:hypothetical protein K3495_g806 [Podosphaera aphanis]|nr:hypothetical protein K3495_g806 [Podosphaera aphanis]